MSRQPSPGPSHNPNHGHFFQAAVPLPTPPVRQKSKAYSSGIAAGAEDVKYAAKYRDLKRKVKEIEGDNDKLLFKVLQAKRNIQRAKLERAILYERLAAIPASPPPNRPNLPPQRTQPAPPHQPHPQAPYAHQQPLVPPVVTVDTRQGRVQVIAGPDGRPVIGADGRFIPAPVQVVPMGPGVAPHPQAPAQAPPPHSRHAHHSSSGARDLAHPPQQHLEPPQARVRSGSGSSNSRSRSHSSQPPPPQLPPLTHFERERDWDRQERHLAHGPPPLQIPEAPPAAERARRHEAHPQAPNSAHSPLSPTDPRRIHNHQRVGPGANINQDFKDRERDREPYRPLRIPTPPFAAYEEADAEPAALPRRGHAHEHERDAPGAPAAGLPRAASAHSSGGSSRPESRMHEHERRRSAGSRLSDLVNADPEPPAPHPADPAAGASDTRKRGHGDMDMDVDGDVDAAAAAPANGHTPAPAAPVGYEPDDRGPKRVHAERGLSPSAAHEKEPRARSLRSGEKQTAEDRGGNASPPHP